MQHLEAQANVLARKEFGYLESWTKYPNFTTNGEFWANLNVNSQALAFLIVIQLVNVEKRL